MLVLKLPPLFPHLHRKGKRTVISNLACFSQKRVRSYILLALVHVMKDNPNNSFISNNSYHSILDQNVSLEINGWRSNHLLTTLFDTKWPPSLVSYFRISQPKFFKLEKLPTDRKMGTLSFYIPQ